MIHPGQKRIASFVVGFAREEGEEPVVVRDWESCFILVAGALICINAMIRSGRLNRDIEIL